MQAGVKEEGCPRDSKDFRTETQDPWEGNEARKGGKGSFSRDQGLGLSVRGLWGDFKNRLKPML